LSSKLLSDLKEAHDRLNRNPTNSSRPPSTQAPWEKTEETSQDDGAQDDVPRDAASDGAADRTRDDEAEKGKQGKKQSDLKKPERSDASEGRPGRREGDPGYSRTQQLPIDAECVHRPETCSACGASLNDACEQHAYTARYEIDLVQPGNGGNGLLLVQTKHIYLECQCQCGHCTREQPGRCSVEAGWSVELTEWHLAGPLLVAFICALALRQRLSRARIREFLHDWLGLELGVATINQCIHEAGRAVEPVVEQEIRSALREVELVYADETSWKEHGQLLWLWVFTCASVTFFASSVNAATRWCSACSANPSSTGGNERRVRGLPRRHLAPALLGAHHPQSTRLGRKHGSRCPALRQACPERSRDGHGGRLSSPRVSTGHSIARNLPARLLAELFTACVDNADSKHEKTRALRMMCAKQRRRQVSSR